LGLPSGYIPGFCAACSPNKKSAPGTDGSAGTGVASGSAEKRADTGSDSRAYGSAGNSIPVNRLLRRDADRLSCPLPANRIIGLEFLKRLPFSGQNPDTWPVWNSRASG
jgi:hypothetical protein